METDAIVQELRRRQAAEALEFERGRETALREQHSEVLAELEGPRIDAAAFAQMDPADVALVREALDPDGGDWLDPDDETPLETERLELEEREAERQRLTGLIEECRRRQAALERYLEALRA